MRHLRAVPIINYPCVWFPVQKTGGIFLPKSSQTCFVVCIVLEETLEPNPVR